MVKNLYFKTQAKLYKCIDLYLLPKWWSIAIWIIVALLWLSNCGIGIKSSDRETNFFPLIDSNNRLHKFRKEFDIGLYDESIMYCVEHHKWVGVKGVYKNSNGVGVLEAGEVKEFTKVYKLRWNFVGNTP